MKIEINENLTSTLERLAAAQTMTPEEYAAVVLNAHLKSQYRQDIFNKISDAPEELKQFDDAVTSIRADVDSKNFVAKPDA